MTEKQRLEQEVINLSAKLSSNSSRIGDWAVIKCLEYKDRGLDMPYDLAQIEAERQQVRDRINEIQAQLEVLVDEDQQ